MPGKKPASATPRRNRIVTKLMGPCTKAMAPDTMPQVTMIRAIQTRAPVFSRITLLGTSNRKYPRKKMPAPHPKT
jgi:hypothetical protein